MAESNDVLTESFSGDGAEGGSIPQLRVIPPSQKTLARFPVFPSGGHTDRRPHTADTFSSLPHSRLIPSARKSCDESVDHTDFAHATSSEHPGGPPLPCTHPLGSFLCGQARSLMRRDVCGARIHHRQALIPAQLISRQRLRGPERTDWRLAGTTGQKRAAVSNEYLSMEETGYELDDIEEDVSSTAPAPQSDTQPKALAAPVAAESANDSVTMDSYSDDSFEALSGSQSTSDRSDARPPTHPLAPAAESLVGRTPEWQQVDGTLALRGTMSPVLVQS